MKRQSIWLAAIIVAFLGSHASLYATLDESELRECPHRKYLPQLSESAANVEEALSEKEMASRGTGKVITSFDDSPGYSSDGVITDPFYSVSTSSSGGGIALQSDGKLVNVGNTGSNPRAARFLNNGSLDVSFGSSGVTAGLANHADQTFVLAQGDGKLVGIGGRYYFQAVRYLSNGALDTSFNGVGSVLTSFGIFGSSPNWYPLASWAGVQPDGKMVLVGRSTNDSPITAYGRMGILRYLTNGALDTSFSEDGKDKPDVPSGHGFSDSSFFIDAAFQTDGKVLVDGTKYVGGAPSEAFIYRYLTNGTLDTTFSGDGIVTRSYPHSTFVSVTPQSDGKILAASSLVVARSDQESRAYLGTVTRFLTNGVLDTSFGTQGVAMLSNGSTTSFSKLILESGKIWGVGSSNSSLLVARFITNGTLDTTFSGDGFYTSTVVSGSYSTALQTDGNFVIASGAGTGGGSPSVAITRFLNNGELDAALAEATGRIAVQSNHLVVASGKVGYLLGLARYLSNGGLDATFDGDGKISTSLEAPSNESGLVLQGDGKVLVSGRHVNAGAYDFGIYRYLSNGTLDATFDTDGKVSTDFSSGADNSAALSLQGDGKILAAGTAVVSSVNRFAVSRYLSNGSLDATFDTDGKQTTNFSSNSAARCVTTASDGKVIAAGDNGSDLAVARYLSNGALDAGFSSDGMQTTNFFGTENGYGCAVQSDGKVLVSGYNSCWGYIIARYLSNGELDTGFGGDGRKIVSSVGLSSSQNIQLLSDGKIVGVGKIGNNSAMIRFLSNGSLDSSFGAGGIQTIEYTGSTTGFNGVAQMSDGRLMAGGSDGTNFTVARCLSCGPLDKTYGSSRDGSSKYWTEKDILNEQIRQCRGDKEYLEELYWESLNNN
jgi:uncharacterized delta-60 repeat protein